MFRNASMVDLFLAIWGSYLALSGVVTLITGKPFGQGREFVSMCTPESLREAIPMIGGGMLIVGIFTIISKIGKFIPQLSFLNPYSWFILIGGAVLGVVVLVKGYRKLVPKQR